MMSAMKFSFVATLLFIGASAWAQSIPVNYVPLGQVKEFLQLSDAQLQTILTNNDEHNRWIYDNQTRIWQVQTEIAQETAKSPLDPNALGIRYAEVETICLEMKDKVNEYRTRNLDVLAQDQKARLKVLEDAIKLLPVISEAESGNLMGGGSYAPRFFTGGSGSTIIGTLVGGLIGPASGCSLSLPIVDPATFNSRTADSSAPIRSN
jgi:hypothetical protein